MRHTISGRLLLAAAIAALAGCGGAGPTPEPRDAVVSALRSTAELEAVHALLRIEVKGLGEQDYLVTIEGDVNVADRELDLAAAFEPDFFGAREFRIVLVDGFSFTRQGADSWSISGGPGQDPLASVPTTARVAEAIEGAIRDPATSVAAEGTESCGVATCLRIRAEVPAEVAWRAVSAMISPADGPAQTMQPLPSGFPGFAIDLWIEKDTLRLRQATNTTVVDRQTIAITIALSRHDEPVTIEAPVQP